ncbi:PilN domain-containing protein [Aliiglaciecola lipolytica]|uniref:Type IV pilus assembly protein PilN n=1 Tax=Aliiglaciecola lipolytica E3 TaxID=1127673 RepID=K6YXV3_9ALTE|nr:PilN domain-containing protein [Aliiglaciecola lipolytica]GAC16065.1 type IV pilus assembly protein PilN [Aliiglaciecola lipolytica E3]
MSHVNLLPWREELRQRQKKDFFTLLFAVALFIMIIVYLFGVLVDSRIANQNQRNAFLQGQIAVLDAEIAKIKDIKESKKAIEQRMALIEQLQTSRNVAPIVFDELARLVPPGVSFRSFSRQGNTVELSGVSESNNRLSSFMRNIENSKIFGQGELSSIVADTTAPDAVSEFKLTFSINSSVAPDFSAKPEEGQL